MTKVIFRTNIDFYDSSWFPRNFSSVPRNGDMVSIVEAAKSHVQFHKMPISLEVKSVQWEEREGITYACCELHLTSNQLTALKLAKVDWMNVTA